MNRSNVLGCYNCVRATNQKVRSYQMFFSQRKMDLFLGWVLHFKIKNRNIIISANKFLYEFQLPFTLYKTPVRL